MAKNIYIDLAEDEETMKMSLDNSYDEDYNTPYDDDLGDVINTGHIYGGESIFDDR